MNSFIQDMLNALRSFYESGMQFLPHLLAAVIIVTVGCLVALLSKVVVRRVLAAAKFDRFCDNAGVTQLLTKADMEAQPSELAGRLVFWLLFVVFLMSGVSMLGLDAVTSLVSGFFAYLPRVFAAMLILLLGFLVGNFLSRAAVLAAVNAGITPAHIFGSAVRLLIGVLAFAMALDQLQIASNIVTAAFAIAFGAVMLGAAIAFGLGGRDVARQMLEERLLDKSRKDHDRFSHV